MLTSQEILALEFESRDLYRTLTIKEYLKELLRTLWQEGEGFSGKRPFGNSGWQYDLYAPLIKHNLISGKFDEDGYIEEIDEEAGDRLVLSLIHAL